MDWLMHNPIADMDGPDFLLLYGSVIILTLAACWWTLRQRDPTGSLPPPIPPSAPDPYEIAYLRGGEKEVVHVVVVNLIQRGYLKGGLIERAPNHPSPRHLSDVERRVFDWFEDRATVRVDPEVLANEIKLYCNRYEERLRSELLLVPPGAQNAARQIMFKGGLVIIGLGSYKLIVALAKGRYNIWFLIIMSVVSLVALYKICSPRLTTMGRAYLKQLRLAFEQLKERSSRVTSEVEDTTLLLVVGIFGIGALAGTPYQDYREMFSRGRSSWGGTGGGGSCGGGCGGGGCGGGGCGGCGGG